MRNSMVILAALAVLAHAESASAQTGACCRLVLGDNVCEQVTHATCVTMGGTYLGDGTTCPNALCPEPPMGACCRAGDWGFDVCEVMRESECQFVRGRYLGDGTTCDGVVCDDSPRGACCFEQFAVGCAVTTPAYCNAFVGTYLGDSTECSAAGCGQVVRGACCTREITGGAVVCFATTRRYCDYGGGIYMGDGATCADTVCPVEPRGACCTPTMALDCRIVTERQCTIFYGGGYVGDDTQCDFILHDVPICLGERGVCCYSDGYCSPDRTDPECRALGGVFVGAGSECADCPCPCDEDGDGDSDVFDLLGFLGGFFGGSADFNGDGATDVFDVLSFLACFFRECP